MVIPVAIILIIAIVVGVFLFVRKDSKEPVIDNNQNTTIDNNDIAEGISPYIKDRTQDEIKETLDTELTDEQLSGINDVISIIDMPSPNEVEYDEDGTMTYENSNGETVVAPPRQDIIDMSEEDIDEDFDKMMDELQAQINKTGQIDPNKPTNNNSTGTDNLVTNPSNPNLKPGEVGIDENGEEVINSAGDRDEFVNGLKDALDNAGYTPGSKAPLTAEEKAGIADALEIDGN